MRASVGLAILLFSACTSSPAPDTASGSVVSGGEVADSDSASGSDSDSGSDPGSDSGSASELPATVALGQGDRAFGVYLARTDDGSADTAALLARLEARGVENVGSGELGCDRGAPEALSLPAEAIVVSVAFATREDADRFVAAWGEPVLGVAEIQAYCRD